jgi:hypothetical protein
MRILAKVVPGLLCLALAACGGGGGGGNGNPPPSPPPPPPVTYTIGGTVSGLAGTVVLQNNAANNLSISTNGAFAFATAVTTGMAYAVTVLTQPAGQTCTASNASGSVAAANVTAVTVSCVTNPLAFLDSTPQSGSTNVARNEPAVLTFDRPLNAATVSGAVSLSSAAGAEPMTAATSGPAITITPARRLLPMALYTMSASTAVQGSNGELLANAVSASFTTRDGTWQATTPVRATPTPPTFRDLTPRLVTDANGNAMAVWEEYIPTSGHLLASRFQPATGWSTPEPIGDDFGMSDPALAVDAVGNVTAVWREDGDLWANRFTINGAGGSWGTPVLLETASGSVTEVTVAANAGGAVMVLFGQNDTLRANLWATRYSGGTWSAPVLVESTNTNDVDDIAIAADAQNNAVAVWRHVNGGLAHIWSNRFDGTSWGSEALIESANAGNVHEPQIAMHDNGTAAVVWAYENGANRQMVANRYVPGTGWSGTRVLDTTGVAIGRSVAVGFDKSGRAFASWICDQGARVCLSSFGVGDTEWSAPDISAVTTPSSTGGFRMAVDASGHVMTTWMSQAIVLVNGVQTYTARPTAMRYLSNGGGWGATEFLDALETYANASLPTDMRLQSAIETSGSVIVVWSNETHNLHAKRFE